MVLPQNPCSNLCLEVRWIRRDLPRLPCTCCGQPHHYRLELIEGAVCESRGDLLSRRSIPHGLLVDLRCGGVRNENFIKGFSRLRKDNLVIRPRVDHGRVLNARSSCIWMFQGRLSERDRIWWFRLLEMIIAHTDISIRLGRRYRCIFHYWCSVYADCKWCICGVRARLWRSYSYRMPRVQLQSMISCERFFPRLWNEQNPDLNVKFAPASLSHLKWRPVNV